MPSRKFMGTELHVNVLLWYIMMIGRESFMMTWSNHDGPPKRQSRQLWPAQIDPENRITYVIRR